MWILKKSIARSDTQDCFRMNRVPKQGPEQKVTSHPFKNKIIIYLPRATSSAGHTVRPHRRSCPGSCSATPPLWAPWASAAPAASSGTQPRGWPRHAGHVWTRGKSCWPWLLPPPRLPPMGGLFRTLSGGPRWQTQWPGRDSVPLEEKWCWCYFTNYQQDHFRYKPLVTQ